MNRSNERSSRPDERTMRRTIDAYLDGTLDAEGVAALSHWIAADDRHARRFAEIAAAEAWMIEALRPEPAVRPRSLTSLGSRVSANWRRPGALGVLLTIGMVGLAAALVVRPGWLGWGQEAEPGATLATQPTEATASWNHSPWLDDASLLARLDFNGEPRDANQRVPGRFKQDAAVAFGADSSPIRLELPDRVPSLTLAAWVRLDGMVSDAGVAARPADGSASIHRGLVMSRGWGRRGQVHWQLKGDDFRFSFFDRGDGVDERYTASPPALRKAMHDGAWHLLVSVIEPVGPQGQRGAIRHYLDGVLVQDRPLVDALPPLVLGTVGIGGWDSSRIDDPRPLRGAMDELWIWSRALSGDEVERFFAESRGAYGG